MKRRILSAMLALALCLVMALPVAAAEETLVYDQARLLTDEEAARLEQRLSQISQAYNAQILVFTVSSIHDATIDQYINHVYDSMGFGYGAAHDGVLLLIAMDVREYRILTNGMANQAIGDTEIGYISDYIVSYLSDGDYADAFMAFADECEYYIDGYINGFPFEAGITLFICLIVGLVAGLIVALVLKGQLKSVRQRNEAGSYIKAGSMELTTRTDLFLYRTVDRRKKQTDSSSSSSGSSGSSRSVGGGRF